MFKNTLPLASAFGAVAFNQPTQNAAEMLIKGDSGDLWLRQLCEGPDPHFPTGN
jgi:hypothetical protein